MSEHTPEPWAVDYGGTVGHIKSLGCQDRPRSPTPTVCQYDPDPHPAMTIGAEESRANARRIVACVNACAGVPIDVLEAHGPETTEYFATLEARADALAARLEEARRLLDQALPFVIDHVPTPERKDISSRIRAFLEAKE